MPNKLFSTEKLIIYSDGGSRGNPGPAAIGFVVGGRKYGEAIGHTTNNVAEYRAVISALKKAKQLLGKSEAKKTQLEIRMDSKLIVEQMHGRYKILEPDLQTLFLELWNLRQDFKSSEFKHIPREENKDADSMVNEALDGKMRSDNQQSSFL